MRELPGGGAPASGSAGRRPCFGGGWRHRLRALPQGSRPLRPGWGASGGAAAEADFADAANVRCCSTAMFLDFTRGHWLTIYRGRLPGDIAPATMRMMTAERPEGVTLPDDMANYPRHSGKFMLKLLAAWMAMGFRRPAAGGVP